MTNRWLKILKFKDKMLNHKQKNKIILKNLKKNNNLQIFNLPIQVKNYQTVQIILMKNLSKLNKNHLSKLLIVKFVKWIKIRL